MTSGIKYEQGEILIVPFPFSDLSGIKQRPVLVLSKADYNQRSEDIITCGITSNIKDSEHSVLINNNNLVHGSIPTESRIKVDKLFTLEENIVRKKIAKINEKMMEQVIKEFKELV